MGRTFVKLLLFLLVVIPISSFAESSYRFGAAVALTGTAAPFGQAELQGLELAVDELNASGGVDGKRVALVVEDTQSTGAGTVTAVTKLLTVDKFQVIIGPSWLDSFQGALPIAHKAGALLITPSAGITNIKKSAREYPFVFSSYIDFEAEIEKLIDAVSGKGFRGVSLLFDQDLYCEGLRTFTKEILRRRKMEVLADHSFQPGEKDFRSILTTLRSKQSAAVIFVSIDQGSVLSFFKQRRQLLPGASIFSSHDMESYLNDPAFKGLLTNLIYVVPADATQGFTQRFTRKFGSPPILTAAHAYDAMMLLVRGHSHGARDPKSIAEWLRSRSHESAAFGTLEFNELGGVSGGIFDIRLEK